MADDPRSTSDATLGRTLGEAGEFGLISELVKLFEGDEHVLVGPGDDAAVLRIKHGHVVVSTDLMVEGRHFRRDWASASDVGHRAAAQNLSDINAMGGTARHLTVGLAAPADLPVAWALDFARGFAEECATVGATVVGGDITQASEVMIAVTVLGQCTQAPVLRSGAQPGDVLALTGRQGWAAPPATSPSASPLPPTCRWSGPSTSPAASPRSARASARRSSAATSPAPTRS